MSNTVVSSVLVEVGVVLKGVEDVVLNDVGDVVCRVVDVEISYPTLSFKLVVAFKMEIIAHNDSIISYPSPSNNNLQYICCDCVFAQKVVTLR